MKKTLEISSTLSLPIDAVTEKFAILAVSGAGKSNAAAVMAEEMFRAGLPWVAIDPKGDWWGIRSSADGKRAGLPVLFFGATGRKRKNKPEPDVPLEDTAGKMIADLIVDERVSCILDMSGFSDAAKIRFLIDFGTQLFSRNEEPLHLFCDECDEYLPQKPFKEETRLLRVFTKILKQGRNFGLGATLISQRSAVVNKNALTQCTSLIAMRNTAPQDRDAIEAWVKEKGGQHLEIVETLPSLENGEAWVWSPQFLHKVERFQLRRRKTFDSGATPKIGEKRAAPKSIADIDLAAVRERMSATIERAKSEDPKELRAQIAKLQREKAELEKKAGKTPEPKIEERKVDVPILKAKDAGKIEASGKIFATASARAIEVGEELIALIKKGIPDGAKLVFESGTAAVRHPADFRSKAAIEKHQPRLATPLPPVKPAPVVKKSVRADPVAEPERAGDVTISGPMQKILNTLASFEGLGVQESDRNQIALFSGASPTSSSYANNLSALSSAGLILYPGRGKVALTEAGRAIAVNETVFSSLDELHSTWIAKVGGACGKILRALIDVYPDPLTKEELAVQVGASPTSSSFANNLSTLRTLGVIDYPGRGLAIATPLLFPPI